jgi:hypothetical protein
MNMSGVMELETSVLQCEDKLQAPAALHTHTHPPGTHWLQDWLGLRTGLDFVAERKITAPARYRRPHVQHIASNFPDRTVLAHITSYN